MLNIRSYECVIRLLGGTENPHPEPEEVEKLCRLLNIVGKALDEGKSKPRMNAIHDALENIGETGHVPPRIKFKIIDVLDMRKAGWEERTATRLKEETYGRVYHHASGYSEI